MDENDDGEDELEDVELEEYQDGEHEIIEEEKEDSEEDQTSPLVQKSS